MQTAADFSLVETDQGAHAALTGDWTAADMGEKGRELARTLKAHPDTTIDLTQVGRFDTAGAFTIIRTLGRPRPDQIQARPETLKLLALVTQSLETEPVKRRPRRTWTSFAAKVGKGAVHLLSEFIDTMAFNGRLIVSAARAVIDPRRIRWTPFIALAERAGLDALPIVAVTSLFIGAVVALLGANMLQRFGAQVFAVELIGIAVLREFCIIITAILLAGRSASAFAAEIGSMKMSQEIDAMQVMGVDPFEALVLPRFMALLFIIPLLTFVAALAGLAGGMLVTWSVLDLSPDFFMRRIVDNVGIVHFWVGLSKAPVMAIVVAAIGCRQGMEVGVDVESLGRRVTSAVVHAIFSIIVLDAIFALIYMKLDV